MNHQKRNMKYIMLWLGVLVFLIPAYPAFSFDQIAPKDAYNLVVEHDNVYILDIRTQAEWQWGGHPGVNMFGEGGDLEGKVVNITFKVDCGVVGEAPDRNWDFEDDVFAEFDPNDVILITMCRGGPRGVAAAKVLEKYNYQVMNMAGGFEGG